MRAADAGGWWGRVSLKDRGPGAVAVVHSLPFPTHKPGSSSPPGLSRGRLAQAQLVCVAVSVSTLCSSCCSEFSRKDDVTGTALSQGDSPASVSLRDASLGGGPGGGCCPGCSEHTALPAPGPLPLLPLRSEQASSGVDSFLPLSVAVHPVSMVTLVPACSHGSLVAPVYVAPPLSGRFTPVLTPGTRGRSHHLCFGF